MSSSSSSSEDDDGRNGGGGGGDYEEPSSSRRRSGNVMWPEPFVEALAFEVATEAARSLGRLAAAPALFNIFQVCSTWREISHSDLLWHNLTRTIWNRHQLQNNTWRDEYIFNHRTACNFRTRRYTHTTLPFFPATSGDENIDGLSCRRLALSDHHLAAGFSDGTIRLYYLPSRLPVSTFRPHHRDDRLGQYSRAVSGIVLSDVWIVFASLDGDIHVAPTNNEVPLRRAHLGDVVNDGALVDFSGCHRWWVGLYAGVPGRAFHVWNAETEELVFVGGSLTDPEAVMGWHLLTELTDLVGRVRVTSHGSAVAATSLRLIVFDLTNQGVILASHDFRRRVLVGSVDANPLDAFLTVDSRGSAIVRSVTTLDEICSFAVGRGGSAAVVGCMNSGYALLCAGGVIRVWEVEHGGYLYSLRERMVEEVSAMVADDRHVALATSESTIHLWDFGA